MNIYFIGGILGAVLVLAAFVMSNYKDVDQGTKLDEALNFSGALLLIIYAWHGGAWPFVVLNAVWAAWSFKILFLDK